MRLRLHQISNILCSILLLSLLAQCRKEEEVFPDVEILTDLSQAQINYGDTLFLEVACADYDRNPTVELLVGDEVFFVSNIIWDQKGDVFVFRMVFNERYLATNQYDIRAKSYNGDNSKSDFEDFSYQTLARRERGDIIASATRIMTYDSLGGSSSKNFRSIDIEFNSKLQVLLCIETNKLYWLSFPDLLSIEENSSSSAYREIKNNGLDTWILEETRLRKIVGLKIFGQTIALASRYRANKFALGETKILISAFDSNLNANVLLELNKINGSFVNSIVFNDEIVDIEHLGNDEFYFISAKASPVDYRLMRYKAQTNVIDPIESYGFESLNDIEVYNNLGMYLVSELACYDYRPSQNLIPVSVISSPGAKAFYDLNQSMYISFQEDLYQTQIGSSFRLSILSSPEIITDHCKAYNK